LSPGYFNTAEEIDLTLEALEKIAETGPPQEFAQSQEAELK
jgi:hypothetical protein